MYKKLTETDIKEVFLNLLSENGSTTNKEVKDKLRENGFWAFQQTVKNYIDTNFQDLGADRNFNGSYNVYTLSDEDDDVFYDKDDEDDDYSGDDGDDDIIVRIPNSKIFTARQLRFTKDSNVELLSKVKNSKYFQYKSDIENILKKREVSIFI